jgi:hypothetical protein
MWTAFLWGVMLGMETRPVAAQGGPPGILSGFGLQITQQLSSNTTDFPAISTTPGLTFRYDPQTQLFERSSTSLGPVFVERGRTIGRGKFEFGVSYLFIDFDQLNGEDVTDFGGPALRTPNAFLSIDKFTLHSHIIPFFATYGITDRWDVSVLFPLVSTFFKSRVSLRIGPINLLFADTHHATGAGDLLFRTKYRFLSLGETFHLAAGLSTRFPTGEEQDIHGKGDYIFQPFLAASQEYGRFDLHAQTGIEFNFDDSDRNRIRYAGGIAVDLIEQLALTLDLIGSSSLKTDRVRGRAPEFGAGPAPMLPQSFVTPIKTDIVDLAVGFKGNLGRVTGFVSFFVPVTDDGLRADFIPAGGLQVSF